MLVHGIVHLMGFDHETDEDAAKMERAEDAVAAAMGSDRTLPHVHDLPDGVALEWDHVRE